MGMKTNKRLKRTMNAWAEAKRRNPLADSTRPWGFYGNRPWLFERLTKHGIGRLETFRFVQL